MYSIIELSHYLIIELLKRERSKKLAQMKVRLRPLYVRPGYKMRFKQLIATFIKIGYALLSF